MLLKAFRARRWSGLISVAGFCLTLAEGVLAQAPDSARRPVSAGRDWATLDRIMGRPGKVQPGGIYKYAFPRGDLSVRVDGVTLRPALALTSWVAFEAGGSDTMAMGDLVLSEAEVTPVLTKIEEAGIEATALHNHLLRESPRVMYLHIEARGPGSRIARDLRAALALTGTPPAPPAAAPTQSPLQLDTGAVRAALGYAGAVNGGVYQVAVPRTHTVRVGGMEAPPAMGVATAINFQPTGGGKAAITGDFVLAGNEVGPVIQALRGADIEVTAVHSHMLTEEPRLFFLHYWANGDAVRLARGLRRALDRMEVVRPAS